MKGFSVIDNNGNLRLTQFGSGSSLPDPVTVAHGGTGLTSVTQGDLLYSPSDGSLTTLPKDTGGTRILTNLGTNHAPQWTDPTSGLSVVPRPTIRKSAWTEAVVSATPAVVIWTSAVSGSSANTDATSTWIRYTTTASSGNTNGFRSNGDLFWIDHTPLLENVIRLPAITNIRIWVVLSNVGAGFISNSDDQHLLKGVGFRFSTSAPDTKWVPWTSDGTTQTIGTGIVAPVANVVTTLSCKVNAAGSTATFTVNNDSSTAQTINIGAGALGTAMRVNAQITTLTALAQSMDITAMYGEWS